MLQLSAAAPSALEPLGKINRAGRAVVATIPSDSHTWNLVFIQAFLEEHGLEVFNGGPCTPIDDLLSGCLAHEADLLVISTVNGHGLIEAPDCIDRIRSVAELNGLPVVLGGKLGVGGAISEAVAAHLVAAGFDMVFTGQSASLDDFRRYLRELTAPGSRVGAPGVSAGGADLQELVEGADLRTQRGRISTRRRNPEWRKTPRRIEPAECIGCDSCQRACPQEFKAIFNHGLDVVIVPELCSGCAKCVQACPVDCIYVDEDWTPAPESVWKYADGWLAAQGEASS